VQEIKDKQTNRDMLVRLKALADLKASDGTMNMTGNLITLLFILVEMSPVLIKLMSKKGLYDAVILTRHSEFYAKQQAQTEINKQNTEKLVEDNRRENDTSDYALKKKAELVKLKIDEWFGSYFS
jgi:riboflavin biosynthesis pyrimidine reductase